MSDIHVLTGNSRGCIDVVLHFDVPVGNNDAGILWKDVIINSGIGGNTSMQIGDGVLQITQVEADLIASGDRHEIRRTFQINSIADNDDSRRDALRIFCVREKVAEIADLQRRLQYAGYTEDVT